MIDMSTLTGWKSKAGAALMGLGGILTSMAPGLGWPDGAAIGQSLSAIGAALLGVGIAHKIEKGGTTGPAVGVRQSAQVSTDMLRQIVQEEMRKALKP